MKDEEKELFTTKVESGIGSNFGLAITAGVVIAIFGVVVLALAGIKGGLPLVIVFLLAFGAFKLIRQ